MAMLHEEVDAVLFEGNRVGIGLGDALDHLEAFDIKLKATWGTLIRADLAGNNDAGLLREALEGFKNFGGHALYVGHALEGAGAVSKDGEKELATFAKVVKPTAESNRLPFMLAKSGDSGNRGCIRSVGGCDFFRHKLPQWPLTAWVAGHSRIARAGWPSWHENRGLQRL
jgi:hypothetical protein